MEYSEPTELQRNPYPERIFTLLSLIFAVVSLFIAGVDVFTEEIPTWMLVAKDFLVFAVLLILMLFFFLRYRQTLSDLSVQKVRYDHQLELIRELITKQGSFYHAVMQSTRASFYNEYGGEIYRHRFAYRDPALKEIMEHSLDAVVTVVHNILKNQLAMDQRNENLSVAVKAIVTGEMASSLCSLPPDNVATLNPDNPYIITLKRDAETASLNTGREVRSQIYDMNSNTDFSRIISGETEDFVENDLTSLEEKGHYKNNNPNWKQQYNASLVVPISHKDNGVNKPTVYGFLTVDSLNKSQQKLFTRENTKPIMAFGADLLALIFLNLEMYDRVPSKISELESQNEISDS